MEDSYKKQGVGKFPTPCRPNKTPCASVF